jgi:uncharacterized protein (DUF1330 family)
MSVIVLVQGNPRADAGDVMQQYQQVAREVIGRHGGEIVTRGSGVGALAGGRNFRVGIVIRFADKTKAEAWHDDPDYQGVLPLREKAYSELEITMYQEA